MNLKILFFFYLLFTILFKINAQPVLDAENPEHDFGSVTEGNIVKHEFLIKNSGDQPLIINNVKSSCGCTTPYWTKEPIPPGQQGIISAAYNSKNRPGSFKKSITVFTNGTVPVKTLYIKGSVIRSNELYGLSQAATTQSPTIEAVSEMHAGKVETGHKIPLSVTITNSGKGELKVNTIRSGCNCVMWNKYKTVSIKSGEKETIELIYSPKSIGKKSEPVVIISNDLNRPQHTITIHAEVVETLNQNMMLNQNQSIGF